jgi:tRNA C32,U32 (ribose-2'-O)-methylase TrmJ
MRKFVESISRHFARLVPTAPGGHHAAFATASVAAARLSTAERASGLNDRSARLDRIYATAMHRDQVALRVMRASAAAVRTLR